MPKQERKERRSLFFGLGESAIKQRKSARAILLNNRSQVLLIQHQDTIPVDPVQPDVLKYWATPGGGIEAGEQPVDALQRELR